MAMELAEKEATKKQGVVEDLDDAGLYSGDEEDIYTSNNEEDWDQYLDTEPADDE